VSEKRLDRGSLKEIGCRAMADLLGIESSGHLVMYQSLMDAIASRIGDGETDDDDARIVYDPDAGLYRYEGGLWVQITDWQVWKAIGEYDTATHGPRALQVNLSEKNLKSADFLGRLQVARENYFSEAYPSFAFADATAIIEKEKFKLAVPRPFLRTRAGVRDTPTPDILYREDDGFKDIPPFDERWIALAPSLRYVREVIGDDPKDAAALQELAGLGLLGVANRAARGIALVGPPGGGKGTVADLIRIVFNAEHVYDGPPISTVTTDYGRTAIVGKRLCIHNDVDDLGSIKQMNRVMSGEAVSCRWLGGHPFTCYPSVATIATLNDMPSLKNQESGGVFRRWLIIRCEQIYSESGITRQDILADAAQHRAGWAAWMLAGAARYMATKRLTVSDTSMGEVAAWRSDSMPWLAWIAGSLNVGAEEEGRGVLLRDIIHRWEAEAAEHPGSRRMVEGMTARRFADGIKEVYPDESSRHSRNGKVYSNLHWRSPSERRALAVCGKDSDAFH